MRDVLWFQIVAQAIGFVGAGLLIWSFQCRKPDKLLVYQLASNLVYTLHFCLLGGFSGGISQCITGFKNVVVLSKDKHKWAKWKGWIVLIILAYVVSAAVTWQDRFSILPCIAMIAVTFSTYAKNGKVIRLANLFLICPCWLTYSIHVHSIPGTIAECITICSIIISFIRYGFKDLGHKEA